MKKQRFLEINAFSMRLVSAGCLLLLFAAFVLFFRDEGVSLYLSWQKDEYSHAFLLVPLAFLWGIRCIQTSGEKMSPNYGGLPIVALGLLLNIVGILMVNLWLSKISVTVSVIGIILSFGGYKTTLAAWKGLVLLFLTMPLPTMVMAELTAQMQLFSSILGSKLLELFSISVYREGNVIDLGLTKLQVAEACSGLRYFFPLFSFGFLLAFLLDKMALWGRLLIVGSTLPISIVMNALRIATIGIVASYWGQGAALELTHNLEGWVVFVFCLIFLFAELQILSFFVKEPIVFESILPSWPREGSFANTKRFFQIGLPLILIFSSGVVGKFYLETSRKNLPSRLVSFDSFPLAVAQWKGKRLALSKEDLNVLHLSDYWLADYMDDRENTLNLYIAYYANQQLDAAPHSPRVCLPGGGWEMALDERFTFILPQDGRQMTVNRAVIRKDGRVDLVYFWLRERGRDVSSTLQVKWGLLHDAFRTGRSDGALIRVTAPVVNILNINDQDRLIQQFLSSFWPALNNFVPEENKVLTW